MIKQSRFPHPCRFRPIGRQSGLGLPLGGVAAQ
jgi:hypothetical protein